MELTGLQIRNMQMLEDLKKTIKELEMKRIEMIYWMQLNILTCIKFIIDC